MPFRDTAYQANDESSLSSPTYGTAVTPDLLRGSVFRITVTNGTGWTLANPTGRVLPTGSFITFIIRNTSGGAGGTITLGSAYKAAAFTAPGNGTSLSVTLCWDGTNYVEVSRVTGIAN